ncbi:hypothetical protein [Trabulsiella odontotermitis]|uniref:DUF2946 domain-containing protein n=1 Tax=Trabulsiella odontotermitis TaxID=379893 RepID=A0A0L0GX85_9ENTR|nr:hypothetical protein [Trabulsiella odontotermitis]KNC93068.1 hypothetical protein GM31_21170 [Trabulsiella odontotermitis]
MHANWINRLRFMKKHLLMFLLAFGWLFIQSQIALAAHRCDIDMQGDIAAIQHQDHQMAKGDMQQVNPQGSLCEKHCIPDSSPKMPDHPVHAALPATLELVAVEQPCQTISDAAWSLTPPASGPPATLRFCRFRE